MPSRAHAEVCLDLIFISWHFQIVVLLIQTFLAAGGRICATLELSDARDDTICHPCARFSLLLNACSRMAWEKYKQLVYVYVYESLNQHIVFAVGVWRANARKASTSQRALIPLMWICQTLSRFCVASVGDYLPTGHNLMSWKFFFLLFVPFNDSFHHDTNDDWEQWDGERLSAPTLSKHHVHPAHDIQGKYTQFWALLWELSWLTSDDLPCSSYCYPCSEEK